MGVEKWAKFMASTSGMSDADKVKATNAFANSLFKYAAEADGADEWQAPEAFLRKGEGDCEDYAAFKYVTLRYLGVPDYQLRVSRVNLNRGGAPEPHVVLLYGDQVLDNTTDDIAPITKRKDLSAPVYSVNSNPNDTHVNGKPSTQRLRKWEALLSDAGISPPGAATIASVEDYNGPATGAQ